MSEYTPETWEIKHAYVDTTEYVERMEMETSRSLDLINAEFDRWLEAHDAEERRLAVNNLILILEVWSKTSDVPQEQLPGLHRALQIANLYASRQIQHNEY
jgi:hypothetical protein